MNSRLDDLQAAVLRARLPLLAEWTIRRRALAGRYRQLLPASLRTIRERDPGHVYHLFVIRTDLERGGEDRTALQARLAARGIETLVHYPVPIPHQPAFAGCGPADCPRATAACAVMRIRIAHLFGQADRLVQRGP